MKEELKRSIQIYETLGIEVIKTDSRVIFSNPLSKRKVVIYIISHNLIKLVSYNNNKEVQSKEMKYHQKRVENIIDYML